MGRQTQLNDGSESGKGNNKNSKTTPCADLGIGEVTMSLCPSLATGSEDEPAENNGGGSDDLSQLLGAAANDVPDVPMSQMDRVGSGLKDDVYHRSVSWVVDDPAAEQFNITDYDGTERSLYQLEGELDGKEDVFEWLVDDSGDDPVINHQRFIRGGRITGFPNQVP
jgi:hypothetical protein